HAIEKKGEAYLLPLEGDLDEVESLIPLRWLYEKLGACKAQDKLIVFDVCRFHPGRGVQRPHFGPMTEALEKALHDSPAGVSVITSCSTGEQSLETDAYDAQFNFGAAQKGHAIDVVGSYFVSMLRAAAAAGALTPEKKLPAPTDEIPVERFATWMTEKLAEVVKNKFSERTQTVKATLKPRGDAGAFDPAEPQPGRFDFPAPPRGGDREGGAVNGRGDPAPADQAAREGWPTAGGHGRVAILTGGLEGLSSRGIEDRRARGQVPEGDP